MSALALAGGEPFWCADMRGPKQDPVSSKTAPINNPIDFDAFIVGLLSVEGTIVAFANALTTNNQRSVGIEQRTVNSQRSAG
jgi:hypothetical protein